MRNARLMLVSFALVLIIGMLVSACGSKVSEGMAPDWFLNPPDSEDTIYGTGASPQMTSIQLATTTADANARAALAQTIQVSVQGMVRTFLQQSGTMDNARALQFTESIGKQVYDVSLVGSRIEKREIKSGRCYSLAEISMDSVKSSLMGAVRDAAAQLAEQKAKDAFRDLENEVGKGNIPIVK